MAFVLVACGTGAVPATLAVVPSAAAQQAVVPTLTATAIPTATAEPSPIPTSLLVLPTALARAEPTPATRTPESTPLALSSEARELAKRLSEEGMEYLVAFLEGYSPRESGTDEERAAANFLRDEMTELGYQADLQELTVQQFSRALPALTLVTPGVMLEQREVRALPMSNSGEGNVAGPVIFVKKAFQEDIPETGLAGSVALIERGQITFQEKVTRAAEAGAIGAIVFNNVPGGFGGILTDTGPIPVVAITREDGLDLQEALDFLQTGDEIIASVFVEIETRTSQNVIAERPGGGGEGVVIIGAHYDTVPDTQAANDNSTGVTSLVLMAKELQDKEFPFRIRFVFFGVEEIGLYGSMHYVDNLTEAERSEIIAMLNFDSTGAGEAAMLGDLSLVEMAVKYSNANGLFIKTSPGLGGGGSDHASFQAAEIPALFLFGDDLSRINSTRDTLEFVNPDIMGRQMVLGLGVLDMLAQSQE